MYVEKRTTQVARDAGGISGSVRLLSYFSELSLPNLGLEFVNGSSLFSHSHAFDKNETGDASPKHSTQTTPSRPNSLSSCNAQETPGFLGPD